VRFFIHFTILEILALAFRGENIKEVAKSPLGYDFDRLMFSLKISEPLFSYYEGTKIDLFKFSLDMRIIIY